MDLRKVRCPSEVMAQHAPMTHFVLEPSNLSLGTSLTQRIQLELHLEPVEGVAWPRGGHSIQI